MARLSRSADSPTSLACCNKLVPSRAKHLTEAWKPHGQGQSPGTGSSTGLWLQLTSVAKFMRFFAAPRTDKTVKPEVSRRQRSRGLGLKRIPRRRYWPGLHPRSCRRGKTTPRRSSGNRLSLKVYSWRGPVFFIVGAGILGGLEYFF